jgi:hypothetical protein
MQTERSRRWIIMGMAVLMGAAGWLGLRLAAGIPVFGEEEDLDEVQIRVCADRSVALPDGTRGAAVQVYGMRVEPDGSEKVVWKQFLTRINGLRFPHLYTCLPLDSGTVYLHIPMLKDDEEYLELDRRVGMIRCKGAVASPIFTKLEEDHLWYNMLIIDRPVINDPMPKPPAPEPEPEAQP